MAYEVVVSLKHTLEPLLLDSFASKFQLSTNLELKVMYEHLRYVKSFFEKVISLEDSNNVEEVEREIKGVVQNSRDLIESHLSDLFHPRSDNSISGFYPELMKVNGELASLVKDLKAKEDCLTGTELGSNKKKILGVRDAASFRNQVIVGMDDELVMLLDRLIIRTKSLEVVPIVGMGGIGKTTLAKEVFFNIHVSEHFDVRLFVEIGIVYELEELLLRLLGEVGREGRSAHDLGLKLFQHLIGKRYLIVLDDMWDFEVWDRLVRFFPDNSNGSRIMLTTRIADVPRHVCSTRNPIVEKRFLDEVDSWELLRKMALSDTEEGCPPELENVGKAIAKNTGGLPLSIVTIGKLLSSSERSVESWMAVAENSHSPVSEILNMSFTQLPQHLKACFLYLGLFPPNSRISAALLIKLWVAEGFIEEDGSNKSLEEKAEEYLQVLVDRSLVIIDELRSRGGIKTCRVHDLLLHLCVTEARLQKFYHIVNEGAPSFTQSTNDQRRLGILGSGNKFLGGCQSLGVDLPLASAVRSLVFICPEDEAPLEVNMEFRWLRVLHAPSIFFREFPDEVVKLVRLRYLAITYDGELPSSISRLRNLEFLIIHRSQSSNSHVFLPLEIWKLQKLRHLECMGFDLPDPSAAMAHGNVLQLRKLATLLGVSARTCTESVLAGMPNLIKLGIWFELTGSSVELLFFDDVSTRLQRLESFKCAVAFMNRPLGSRHAFRLHEFPSGLRKLSLSGCGFVWGEHMSIISHLPNLQVLKLRWHSFCGTKWTAREDGFHKLARLVLEDLDLERWEADCSNFPKLDTLHIRRCHNLIEIPSEIGDVATLKFILLDECSESVIESARRIEEEITEICGAGEVHVRILSSGEAKTTYPETSHSNEKEPKIWTPFLFPNTRPWDYEVPPGPAQALSKYAVYEIPIKTISGLGQDEEVGEFWVYATVSSIEKIGAWAYLACELCFAMLKPDDDEFFCEICNTYDIRGRLRYNLSLGVSDETGAATFRLWESEFLTLIAETDYELNKVGELEELPMAIESLVGKEALFKVLVEEGQTQKFTGAYCVTQVIRDADEVRKFLELYSEMVKMFTGAL